MNLTSDADVILVKDSEKSYFINKFTKTRVMELPEQPVLSEMEPKCFYYTRNLCKCILLTVLYLYETFQYNLVLPLIMSVYFKMLSITVILEKHLEKIK